MKQKNKSIFEIIFNAPFGLVMILLWIVLIVIVGSFKLYNEIRYHLSDHIFDGLFFLGIILFGVICSIVSYFVKKKKEKNLRNYKLWWTLIFHFKIYFMIQFNFIGDIYPTFEEQQNSIDRFIEKLGPFKEEFEQSGGTVVFNSNYPNTDNRSITFNVDNNHSLSSFIIRWNEYIVSIQ
jgi:magnesium-transporting ATPase (P-type)